MQRKDVVFRRGDKVRVVGSEVEHLSTGRTVPTISGEGKGETITLSKQFDESAGATITNKATLAFSFRQVLGSAGGTINITFIIVI